MSIPVIEIENLTKDFSVGFWKNGAGKSTTLKILMHLLHPTSGTARILGQPTDSVSMHQSIGYLPENPYFYDYLTPEELLTYMGRLFGMRKPVLSGKVDSLLQRVGLAGSRKLQLRKFSKGMVQRIGIAQAIINDPEIVFLDEPMSGLDPLGRMEVRQIITALKAQGVTVFFSSHILPDVEAICDRVAIMNKGKLQQVGALEEILKVGIEGHEVILAGWSEPALNEIEKICDEVRLMGNRLRIRLSSRSQMESLFSLISARKLELISINPLRPSLEEYFQSLVGNQPLRGEQ
jgi:ABC-2 type transport system ATP-binding protein